MHRDRCFHLVAPTIAETDQECTEHQAQGSCKSLWGAADSGRPCPPPALTNTHSSGTRERMMSICSSPLFARQIPKGSVSVSDHAKYQICCWEQTSKENYIKYVVWVQLHGLMCLYCVTSSMVIWARAVSFTWTGTHKHTHTVHKWLHRQKQFLNTVRSLGGVPCISLPLPIPFAMHCADDGTMHTFKPPPHPPPPSCRSLLFG